MNILLLVKINDIILFRASMTIKAIIFNITALLKFKLKTFD